MRETSKVVVFFVVYLWWTRNNGLVQALVVAALATAAVSLAVKGMDQAIMRRTAERQAAWNHYLEPEYSG